MIRWRKKLIYSLVSWTVAAILATLIESVSAFLTYPLPDKTFSLHDWILGVAFFLPVFMIAGFLGWVVSIPIALLIDNFRGLRFWMYLTAGSLSGPLFWFAIGFPGDLASHRLQRGLLEIPRPVYVVSFATTLIYLVLMRRAQLAVRRESPPSAVRPRFGPSS
jgi:hypothetical protein